MPVRSIRKRGAGEKTVGVGILVENTGREVQVRGVDEWWK